MTHPDHDDDYVTITVDHLEKLFESAIDGRVGGLTIEQYSQAIRNQARTPVHRRPHGAAHTHHHKLSHQEQRAMHQLETLAPRSPGEPGYAKALLALPAVVSEEYNDKLSSLYAMLVGELGHGGFSNARTLIMVYVRGLQLGTVSEISGDLRTQTYNQARAWLTKFTDAATSQNDETALRHIAADSMLVPGLEDVQKRAEAALHTLQALADGVDAAPLVREITTVLAAPSIELSDVTDLANRVARVLSLPATSRVTITPGVTNRPETDPVSLMSNVYERIGIAVSYDPAAYTVDQIVDFTRLGIQIEAIARVPFTSVRGDQQHRIAVANASAFQDGLLKKLNAATDHDVIAQLSLAGIEFDMLALAEKASERLQEPSTGRHPPGQ